MPAGGAGTPANPIPVSATGDVIVTMTFWRPQRKAIPGSGEGSDWVDIGGLKYTADVPNAPVAGGPGAPGARGPGNCAASTYSTTDPNLKVGGDGVEDSSADRPSVPGQHTDLLRQPDPVPRRVRHHMVVGPDAPGRHPGALDLRRQRRAEGQLPPLLIYPVAPAFRAFHTSSHGQRRAQSSVTKG